MRITNRDFDYYTSKKYFLENINFLRKRFVLAFRKLLKGLNFIPTPKNCSEIYDFLKKDIKLSTWIAEQMGLRRYLRH